MSRSGHTLRPIVLGAALIAIAGLNAQDKPKQEAPANKTQSKKDLKKLQKELDTPYKKWLQEEVPYIITDEERSAFLQLQTNEEREQFIEAFWQRRDPTPDTVENEFKEEHYRRIAYANEHFASGIPGWKTDRGRIYVIWGKPDELESPKTITPPQVELAARAAKEIPKLNIEAWDEHHQKLVTQLLNAKTVDPFLRYFLVLRTMKYASLGNSLLEPHLVQPLKLLNESKVDLSVAWMDPDDPIAKKVRALAENRLVDLTPEILNAAWRKLSQSQKALAQDLFAAPLPIGCLERSASGTWKVLSEWTPEKEHQLYCATSTVDGGNLGPLVWRHIGRKFGKDFAIDFSKDLGITEGMVVFASAEPLRPAPTK